MTREPTGNSSTNSKTCQVDGCTHKQLAIGLCYNHYHNFKYHRNTGKYTNVESYIQKKKE